MKRSLIISCFLLISSSAVFAQNSELENAFTFFNLRQQDKAKEAIDKATANSRTMNEPKTWAYRGLIYSALALDSTKKASQDQNLKTALEAIAKGQQLDTKKEYKKDIDNASRNLAQVFANKGIVQFNNKDYKGAEESFKFVSSVIPSDTSFMLNTAVAASKANDFDQAIKSYTDLIKVKPALGYYQGLIEAQGLKKDSAAYLKTLQEARIKFPTDNALINDELNYYLKKGQSTLVIDKLKSAINNDPKNTNLYAVLGSAYENVKKVDSAEDIYKKALALTPNDYTCNFNLGVIYFNKAAQILSNANKLPRTKVKEYNAEVAKFKKAFEVATPYLEAALAAKPDDVSTMSTLKEIYARTNQGAKAADMEKRMADQKSKSGGQ